MKRILLFLAFFTMIPAALLAGTVDTVEIYSAAMHRNIPCVVIKPNDYRNKKLHFPTVYLLHGYSGNYSDWITKVPALKQDVDRYQILIVCPDGGYSSWYIDSPLDTAFRYETYVGAEVPAYIDAHYKTIPDRMHRASAGLSMGGHGAFFLALRHKDFFGAVGSMSGGVDIRPFPDNWDIKKRLGDEKTHPENWEKYTVINLVDSLKNDELKIIFSCGVNDFFISVNRALHQKLLALKIDHDYTERPGAHTWDFWSNAVEYQLLFFSRFFNQPH